MSTNKAIIDCWKFVKFRHIHLLLVVEILVSEESSEVLTVVVALFRSFHSMTFT